MNAEETARDKDNTWAYSGLLSDQNVEPLLRIKSVTVLVMVWWTLVILLVLFWHLFEIHNNTTKVAHFSAVQSFEKDLVYRRWASSHGGVYVPATDDTPPNPYLAAIKNRDLVSPWGKKYTLMNPAYMTRQVHELGREQYGYHGHITSLNPLRPENAADAWETEALQAFEKGKDEVSEIGKIGDIECLRVMRPMVTEKSCLKCHAGQGYKEGDLRGGISVSVPMVPLRRIMFGQMIVVSGGYILIWILGLGGIGFSSNRIGRRIRERERAKETLRASEDRFKQMFDNMNSGVAIYRAVNDGEDFVFVDFNSAGEKIEKISREDLIGIPVTEVFPGVEEFGLLDVFRRVWRTGESESLPVSIYTDKRITSYRENFIYKISSGEIVAIYEDVTPQKKAETRLRQAQKMEAVGHLAGGVAHDFNNLLMGIMGYVELCRDNLEEDHPIRGWLDEISSDSQRSAGVVRQLMAFARKQTIAPVVMDLNDSVSGMLKMLSHLIGEDINISWKPGANLWQVKMDPSQIDQILTNLCVNARDAIDGTGSIEIETKNKIIDADYCSKYEGSLEGEYVLLTISDNGKGMDAETISQVFDPFFTTKSIDGGTGLGLSTVYGIVKQNSGFVSVYSEIDQGTTFRIYLPRVANVVADAQNSEMADEVVGGSETILIVEDEKSIRVTLQIFLQEFGYTVLTAESPENALRQVEEQALGIDLLITDVIMPGMNGRELADKLYGGFAELKVLYMSGYTANVIEHKGIIDKEMNFISKPFSREVIAQKVREIFDDSSDVRGE